MREIVGVVAQGGECNAHHHVHRLFFAVARINEGLQLGIGHCAFVCHHGEGETDCARFSEREANGKGRRLDQWEIRVGGYLCRPIFLRYTMNEKMKGETKKLYVETYGCQMNVADTEVVASVMQTDGYELTANLEEADAVFVNTCSVRDNAEQRVVSRLQYFRSLKRGGRPRLIVGVLGCMAERAKEELVEKHGVDLVAGPDSYMDLPNLVGAGGNVSRREAIEDGRGACDGVRFDHAGVQ